MMLNQREAGRQQSVPPRQAFGASQV